MAGIRVKKFRFLFLLFLFLANNSFAQEIKIKADNLPLDQVLIELRLNYGIQTSFDHQLISSCLISDSSTYLSPEQAIKGLIEECNFSYDYVDGVFIIYGNLAAIPVASKEKKSYYFSGQLIDGMNTEPLPFSTIKINSNNFIADVNGNFSFRTFNSRENLVISHLGYYMLDTLLTHGDNIQIKLTPAVLGMEEVVVSSDNKIYNAHVGAKAPFTSPLSPLLQPHQAVHHHVCGEALPQEAARPRIP